MELVTWNSQGSRWDYNCCPVLTDTLPDTSNCAGTHTKQRRRQVLAFGELTVQHGLDNGQCARATVRRVWQRLWENPELLQPLGGPASHLSGTLCLTFQSSGTTGQSGTDGTEVRKSEAELWQNHGAGWLRREHTGTLEGLVGPDPRKTQTNF